MSDGRLAAIDIGSNTLHMIVVRRQRGNRLTHVVEKSRLMELGLLEERKGGLPDYAQGSIRRTLESFVRQAREAGASEILIGATAALRDDVQRSTIASGGAAHHICNVAGTPRHLLTRAALERALRHLLKKLPRKSPQNMISILEGYRS